MKAKVLDSGKSAIDRNWVETEGPSFQLWIDGKYIAAVTVAEDSIIVVSTFHSIELRGDA
jgi:hypothetical protein